MKELFRDKLKQEPVSTLLILLFIIILFREIPTGTLSHEGNLGFYLLCEIEMGPSMRSHTRRHSSRKKDTIRGRLRLHSVKNTRPILSGL